MSVIFSEDLKCQMGAIRRQNGIPFLVKEQGFEDRFVEAVHSFFFVFRALARGNEVLNLFPIAGIGKIYEVHWSVGSGGFLVWFGRCLRRYSLISGKTGILGATGTDEQQDEKKQMK